ncbi:MAG: SCO family protein [Acidobacteriota bacterium]
MNENRIATVALALLLGAASVNAAAGPEKSNPAAKKASCCTPEAAEKATEEAAKRPATSDAKKASCCTPEAAEKTPEKAPAKPEGAKASCCTPEAAETAGETKAPGGKAYARSVEKLDIPNLTLVAMDGTRVTLQDVLAPGKPVLLNFIFTTCTTICPVLSATFSAVQDGLGEDVTDYRMVSISIDPERDTPARLREYAARHHAGPQWVFLTGQVESIKAAQEAFEAYRGSKFNHAPLTFLRAADDDEWVRLEGLVGAKVVLDEVASLGAAE